MKTILLWKMIVVVINWEMKATFNQIMIKKLFLKEF